MSRKLSAVFLCALAISLTASRAAADITTWSCHDDGDGAVICPTPGWVDNGDSYTMTITGNQYWGPGHIVGNFATDTPTDPTIGVINYIDNDTTFTWTDYHVNVYMNKAFTIAGAVVLGPPGWSTATTPASGGAFLDSHGNAWSYKGTIDMNAGNPVPFGNTLSFTYSLSFAGSAGYEQEMTPSPEPATMALLLMGGLGLLARKNRK